MVDGLGTESRRDIEELLEEENVRRARMNPGPYAPNGTYYSPCEIPHCLIQMTLK